ncbi:hypothetical protein L1049_007772 [Liquidambar formosana]|uniref:Legume lectin domain-containing protein n=1 Tax=Liquidambar formosana TaxID=63359 RepID=A0AAP0X8N8_LIQFO
MASFSILRYVITLTFFILFFETLTADPFPSFSFKGFDKDPNFESNISLFGDAKVANGGSSSWVQLTRSASSSAGRLMYKKPIKLVEGNPSKLVSFSTYFSFSMSPENGDGLAFAIVPIGFPVSVFDGSSFGLSPGLEKRKFGFFAVEFDTYKNAKYGDLNENHVGVDVGSLVSARVKNVSSINIVLNSGNRLHCWIDYEAGSRQLEVRLSKLDNMRPVDPLLIYPIDFSEMWREEEVFVGLSSSSANSSQTCAVYSWSFKLRPVPQWMHSEPLDPRSVGKNTKPASVHKRSACLLRILAALIFGTGCGALGAFIVLFMCSIFGNRRPVVPAEFAVHPVEYEYKKIKVVVDKAIKDGEKVGV